MSEQVTTIYQLTFSTNPWKPDQFFLTLEELEKAIKKDAGVPEESFADLPVRLANGWFMVHVDSSLLLEGYRLYGYRPIEITKPPEGHDLVRLLNQVFEGR